MQVSIETTSGLERRLTVGVPAERVEGEEGSAHPFQLAIARALEARTGRPFPASPATVHPDLLLEALDETGFEPDERVRYTYEGRQSELIELLRLQPSIVSPYHTLAGSTAAADHDLTNEILEVDRIAEKRIEESAASADSRITSPR